MPLKTDQGVVKLITYVSVVKDDRILLIQYVTPPNPNKKGWWIPAPEIDWAEEPHTRVSKVLNELGLPESESAMTDVESFVVGGAWHVIFHYRVEVSADPNPQQSIEKWSWFSADDLPPANEIAHGKWERELAIRQIDGRHATIA